MNDRDSNLLLRDLGRSSRLRFAFHRPAYIDHVSTRCHRKPCGGDATSDVPCSVQIGISLVPARYAPERRLALAALRCDMLTGRAGLRRIRGVDLDHPTGGLV